MKVGYVRVSTAEQNTARQDELMERLGVERVYTDKTSGKDSQRPQLQELLRFVREGDIVIVESYSRLARSTKDLLSIIDQLNQKGVVFISQKEQFDTATPQGKLMLTMFGAIAEFEREVTLQRQAEGIAIAKAQGKYKGRPRDEVEGFEEWYQVWKKGEVTATRVCRELGISRATFYRRVNVRDGEELVDF